MKSHRATPCDASSVPGASYLLTKPESKVNLKHNSLTAEGKYFLHPITRGLLKKVQIIGLRNKVRYFLSMDISHLNHILCQ
ncbi:hypothetical protein OIU77_011545 [Salix suchowensis]|uniref:Uncharacterized protein n=1 Tax=Salix suchowensis TaxID=1278906 RepID=A0ABQ9A2D0_9ROSI|nr:hypothetical protein OIU77_011545 [Salix suchowensis]